MVFLVGVMFNRIIKRLVYGSSNLMTPLKYATPFEKLHAASLLAQKARINKFACAIKTHVADGDYVVELGSGSGIFSLIAAKAGAKKVTGVEINPDSIAYAKEAARINGLEERVEFVESHYLSFKPQQKADLVICEMLSSMLLVEQQVTACYHAVSSLLRSGGTILPHNARVYTAPATCPSLLERFRWNRLNFPRVPQTVGPDKFTPLSEPKLLAEFDFSRQDPPERVNKILEFRIQDDDLLTGVVGYFEVAVDEEVTLHMDDGWRHLFLSLDTAKRVSEGDVVRVHISYMPGHIDTLEMQLK